MFNHEMNADIVNESDHEGLGGQVDFTDLDEN